jgi:hypothetical protein
LRRAVSARGETYYLATRKALAPLSIWQNFKNTMSKPSHRAYVVSTPKKQG